MSEDFLEKEYFTLLDIVKDADHRLLTIKGWGVTLGLASLGVGFQTKHYGLFLVAAVSALTFWVIEAITKKHQMRHYIRLREIEVCMYAKKHISEKNEDIATPLINWSWEISSQYLEGKKSEAASTTNDKELQAKEQDHQPLPLPQPERYKPFTLFKQKKIVGISAFDIKMYLYPHVLMPHLVTFLVGILLLLWGIAGHFPEGYLRHHLVFCVIKRCQADSAYRLHKIRDGVVFTIESIFI